MKRFLRKLWARMYLRWDGVCLKHYQEKRMYTLDGETIHELCPSCEAERDMLSAVARQRAIAVLQPQDPPAMQIPKSWN